VSRQLSRASLPAIATACWCMTLACLAVPARAIADDAADERPPTSLEQTLVEHVCNRLQSGGASPEAHDQCVGVQFHALRAEFGYNLNLLTSSERGRIDSTCSRLRKPENVEPYLNCLTALLVAAREERRGASGIPPGEVSFGLPFVPPPASAAPRARGRFWIVVVTLLGGSTLSAAAVVGFLRFKKRTPQLARVCQRCGEALNAAGDLCSACRHEAGVAAKQAIADRAAEERAEHERQRVEREQAEERQRQRAAQAEERQRLEEAQRKADVERPLPEVALPHAVLPRTPSVAAIGADLEDTPHELDAYTVLGVSREASRQEIDRAYCLAASKYDETQVAHLGDAIQAHYRAKAEAIEHAYRSLTGTAA